MIQKRENKLTKKKTSALYMAIEESRDGAILKRNEFCAKVTLENWAHAENLIKLVEKQGA